MKRKLTALGAGLVLAIITLLPAQASTTAPTAAASGVGTAVLNCTPTELTGLNSTVTYEDRQLGPWDHFNVDFTIEVPDGVCPGSWIDMQLPEQLRTQAGTHNILDPDGIVIGTITYEAGYGSLARIYLNDYVLTHENITIEGNVNAQLWGQVSPGETVNTAWVIAGQTYERNIEIKPCEGECAEPPTDAEKWAQVESDDDGEFVDWAITSLKTTIANETVTITDQLGPGQAMDCASVRYRFANEVNEWGDLQWGALQYANAIVAPGSFVCDDSGFTLVVVIVDPGTWVNVLGHADMTEDRQTYTDTATITHEGQEPIEVSASAYHFNSDIGGGGNQREVDVDIEKWSSNDGLPTYDEFGNVSNDGALGDFDEAPGKELVANEAEPLTFTISNNGRLPLVNIVVTDELTSGTGELTDLNCVFPDGSEGTEWAGPLPVAQQFTCTATLPALGHDATHSNTARVVATGQGTQTTVEDSDDWHGRTPPPPTTPEPEPEPEPGPEPKPEPKPEPGPEPKPEPGPEPKPEPGPQPKPEPTPPPALPRTGFESDGLLVMAALLMGAGIIGIGMRKRIER